MAEYVKCHSHDIIESEKGIYCCNCRWDSEKEEYVKRMTNADRIHSMNIEELAELLYSFHNLEDKVKFCKNKTECDEILDSGKEIPDDMCKKCLVEWLQSEVEV